MKLNLKALALSLGILFAVLTFVLGVWFSMTGFAKGVISMIQEIYAKLVHLQFSPTRAAFTNLWKNFSGIILLTVFSFVDGVIGGLLIGFFYNLFLPQQKK